MKLVLLLFIALSFIGCKKKKNIPECKLSAVSTSLFFYDDFQPPDPQILIGSGKLKLEYNEGNDLKKISGGLTLIPNGSSFCNWALYDSANEIVSQQGSNFKIYHYTYIGSPIYQTRQFTIENGNILYRKESPYSNLCVKNQSEYTYQKSGSTILEFKNGSLVRTFYLNNGNLSMVETIFKNNLSGEIIGKTEFLFIDYDNSINYLKGKFYIIGAFYRSFSDNNYRKMIIKYYSFLNNQYSLTREISYDYSPFQYNSNNVLTYFDVLCK